MEKSRKQYFKDYHVKNREKAIARSADFYKKNKEHCDARSRAYHNTKHGKILAIISNVNARCYNPNHKSFKNYGAKGITNQLTYDQISILWDRDKADQMERASIDRIYIEKDYTFGNCQFIEHRENCGKDKRKKVAA